MKNKISLTVIALLANFILAGFATQFGLLIEPIASAYSVTVEAAAFGFSVLNGGALLGTICAFFLMEKFNLKIIGIGIFSVIILAVAILLLVPYYYVFVVAVGLIGIAGGCGLCFAGTIIVKIWQEKIQSTLFLAQDVIFNVAGVVFPLYTTYLLSKHFNWNLSYFAVGLVSLVTFFIVIFTNFKKTKFELNSQQVNVVIGKNPWSLGVIISGICLFLSMLALYAFLTWAPIFVKGKFNVPIESAGDIITRYWAAALVGSVTSALILTKIKIQHFVLLIMIMASIATTLLVTTKNYNLLPYLTYFYGFVGAAVYNTFIAFGVSTTSAPSGKHISYIVTSGSAGAMFSPAISSLLKESVGLQFIMYAIPLLYLIIIGLIIIQRLISK